jgi:two-component sensor histidine kinase
MVTPAFILFLSRARTLFLLLSLSFTITVQAQKIQLQFSKGTKDDIPTSFKQLSPSDLSKHISFWVQVTISSDIDQHKILKAGNWYMQQVSFYDGAGKPLYVGNNFEVSLLKGNNTFYLYFPFVDDKDSNGLTVLVSSIRDFNTEYFAMRTNQIFFAASVGMLFLLSFMYSIFIRSSDRIYIHYALYLFAILVFFTYQYGILGDVLYVVKRVPPAWFWIFSDFISITYLYFSQSFLDMKKKDPLLHRVFNFGIYLVSTMVVIETISYLFEIDALHSVWFKGPVIAFQIIIFPFIFYRVYKQKTILGWLFLASLIIVSIASMAGQVASTFKSVSSTNFILQSATLIDAFIFSIGIAIRFGISNKEKQQIQNDLISQLKINEKIQEQNAAQLETKVIERTEALNKRNRDNELLIKEIHHRVKNNLQVVSSLLNIAERKISDENAKQPFRDSANRINSMGLIHSFLYQNENFSEIDLENYIRQLTDLLADSFRAKYPNIQIVLDVGPVNLNRDSAIEMGLIINELVTNSLKHGVYANDKPVIKLSMQQEESKLNLRVKDNGLTNGNQNINVEASFGMRMISALAKKLNGTMSIQQENGFEVRIVFETIERIAV